MIADKSLQQIKSDFKNKDILSIDQFDTTSISLLFDKTNKIISQIKKGEILNTLRGKIATLIFYEPSSRTFGSFASAFKRLGGQTIDFPNPLQTSSAVKGETLEDSIKMFECYSDVIVIRHPEIGAAKKAAFASVHVPVINAGDGAGEHPTQALLDSFTLQQRFGKLEGLKGLMTGDLLYGRTVHSLIRVLSLYKNVTLYLLSPKNVQLPRDLFSHFKQKGITLVEIENENDIPKDCQFWYWTRVQKERFTDKEEYEKLKTKFILTAKLLKEKGNKNMIIMHPLPRVGEIDIAVDSDPRSLYLTTQPQNGVYVRMALLSLVLTSS